VLGIGTRRDLALHSEFQMFGGGVGKLPPKRIAFGASSLRYGFH
jgi:hypothetical protein